jgi:hypothetical protein
VKKQPCIVQVFICSCYIYHLEMAPAGHKQVAHSHSIGGGTDAVWSVVHAASVFLMPGMASFSCCGCTA